MSGPSSPTSRALRTLELLQARPGLTATELGQRLGVSERAARRYVTMLREADIPVESTRGPYGGYRLGRGTRLPPVHFTEEEALSLVMAVLDAAPDATGDDDNPDLIGRALSKVVRALPESIAQQALRLREHASAAPDRSAVRADPGTTSRLVSAVADLRRVHLTYRTEKNRLLDVEVDPWAVVVRHGRWYLLCHSHAVDAVRTYRIDRIASAELLDEPSTIPDGLDPVASLEAHLGLGWAHETRVRFRAPAQQVARWVRPTMGTVEPIGPDECLLIGTTNNASMYVREWLAQVPLPYTIEGGSELLTAAKELEDQLREATSGRAS